MLKGLYRDATVFAYVPRAEGWGLPPMEALHEGTRVVASATTPSASNNREVVLVDPLDVSAIAAGLAAALELPDDEAARARRTSERRRSHLAQRGARSSGDLAMKVALDVSAVPLKVAGAGRYIVEVARRLPSRGVDTTLVARRHDVERWRELSPQGTLAPIVPRGRVARLATEALLLGRSATARASDVWHGPHYTMPHGGRVATVVTVHDLTFFTNPEWHERSKVEFFRRAIRYSAAHARVLISVSAFSARLLEEILPAHAPIVVAPLGVQLDKFTTSSTDDPRIRNAHDLAPAAPYIFFVGTVEPRKGLDVLLAAFREVGGEDTSIELWLAGQSGWGVGPLESAIAEHPYRARIRRLGFVDDALLGALYRGATVVAYPSRGEGFGLPVLEAMACGAHVVTTLDTVMAEVAGGAASLVPIGDAEALANGLLGAIRAGEAERASWSSRARSRAEQFTWDTCVDQHLVAYSLAMEG